MSEPQNPTFQIPRDVIEPVIKAHIATAITTALGGQANLIDRAISGVLFQKVDSEGKASHYVRSDSDTLVEYLCKDAIRNAARDAIVEEVLKYKDTLKKHIGEQLTKKNSPLLKQLAEGIVKGLIDAADNKWRISVHYEDK